MTSTGSGAVNRRGTRAFATAMTIAQLCALLRYTVLARILGPVELGLAVSIVLTGQFFDAVTDSGNDRFLVQDRDGDRPRVQMLVQFVAVCRGVFNATALVLFAIPVSAYFGTPHLAPGLMILAAAPLIGGFIHLDLRRTQRQHDFNIEGRSILLAEIASLACVIAAAFVTRSFFAVVIGLVVRSAVMVVCSHVLAVRRYRIAYCRRYAGRLFRFGWPLMINGLLIFFGSQSDRLLIGKYMGVAELGRYSALSLLIYYPIVVLQRFLVGLYLPQVAEAAPSREKASEELGGVAVMISSLATIGFVLVAPLATYILFGPRFSHGIYVIGLVAVLNALRFLRLWPVNLALGAGKSGIVLANNVTRILAIPVAVYCAARFHTLDSIVIGFVVGELAALIVGLALFNRYRGLGLAGFDRVALYAILAVAVPLGCWGVEHGSRDAVIAALVATIFVLGGLAFREGRIIRSAATMILARRKQRGTA